MDNNKKTMTLIAIISLLVIVVAGTYAYFAPQAGGTTSTNANVTSNTTDLLTFSINRDISFTVTQNEIQDEWYTANINCVSYDSFAMCSFSGYNCTIYNTESSSCGDYYGDGGCWASSDGTSYSY